MCKHYCLIVTANIDQYAMHTSVATENVFKEDPILCKANSLLCKMWGPLIGCYVVDVVSDISKYHSGITFRVKQSGLRLLDPADKGARVL